MIRKPIYEPSGRAEEYGRKALNIYNGCNHGCTYCFAPLVLRKDRVEFHSHVEPRKEIVESVRRQLDREQITGELIHICFSCDPYPAELDTTPTRELIKVIKDAGNHVQILTKGGRRAERDFDLLDSGDWFGISYTGLICEAGVKNKEEPGAAPDSERFETLKIAKELGINTWVSCEPVLEMDGIFLSIVQNDFVDHYKIGKLNYGKSDISWMEFGQECIRLCKEYKRDFYIKEDLRKLMGVSKAS